METIKALIIEDEELARELIKNYLKETDFIEIIHECDNGFDGLKAIGDLKPDLIFLDIQMPKLNGFEMLELVDDPPEIIFITAHNEFAIRAFEMNAVDYLMKPYSNDRLLAAVEKAAERIKNKQPSAKRIHHLIKTPITEKMERIVVKSGSRIRVIPVEKILYLEAQDDYVMIYTEEGKHLKQSTMKHFEDCLDPARFVRVHRSYIVQVDQVVQLEPYSKDNYILKLKNGTTIKVSRSGLKSLKEKLSF
ncbi:MAG: response regulator transcription factor [Bacteroidales bacterium]|nr:response regulator transcription factor [Bacteroidales bacterium]MBN2763464.1 response regulator transcription factor [Bacteroidales bacterium]